MSGVVMVAGAVSRERSGIHTESPSQASERAPRGEVAAHAVHAAARRRRRRAEEDARVRRRVRVEARHRSREELRDVGGAAGDGAADVVRVVGARDPRAPCGGARGCGRGSRERSARSAARWRPCSRRSSPAARGSTRSRCACPPARGDGSNCALLHDHHERTLRVLAAPHRRLGRGDLLERAADVHGRRVEAARVAPRDRSVERPVELEHAGTVDGTAAGAARSLRAGPGRRCPRARRGWCRRGRTRAGGRSARRRTCTPVSIVPPSDRSNDASASAMACDPPAATGQSSTCAVSAKIIATAPVSGRSSGRIECAAQPASTARARRPPNRARSNVVAGSKPGRPKRAIRNGCRGRRSGPSRSASRPCGSRRNGAKVRRYRSASSPSAAAVSASERRSITAGSSSSGWATDAGGWIQRRPCASRSERAEERRQDARGVTARADVVPEPGQRELRRARAAADLVARFEHAHRQRPRARARPRRRVRSGPSRRRPRRPCSRRRRGDEGSYEGRGEGRHAHRFYTRRAVDADRAAPGATGEHAGERPPGQPDAVRRSVERQMK